jgi:ubiquinone/menaquinone biosynthesis C-methylase UbiE
MSFYSNVILPRLCHLAMRNRRLLPYRERVIASAEGRVLEIGIGSGLNLPLYTGSAERVVGLDPAPRLLDRAAWIAARARVPVQLVEGSAEAIPLDDRSMDTVVVTGSLCSISHTDRALGEVRRVLKASGRLLFVEHGRAPEPGVRWWQDRLTPLWQRIAGGCQLNRPMAALIEDAGFRFDRLETGYMPGPRPMSFMYEGSARPI